MSVRRKNQVHPIGEDSRGQESRTQSRNEEGGTSNTEIEVDNGEEEEKDKEMDTGDPETHLVLPVEQFSPAFVSFVTECMQKDPERRLSINNMVNHEFLRSHSNSSALVISQWVKGCLQQMHQAHHPS